LDDVEQNIVICQWQADRSAIFLVSSSHEQNIIRSKTCLDGTTHEQVGSKGKERKKASNDNIFSS